MRRGVPLLLALVLVAAVACTGSGPDATSGSPNTHPSISVPPPPKAGALERMACSMPNAHDILARIWHGYDPARSGQVQFIPYPPDFVDGGINHSGPWNYLQRLPLLFYGPGYIKAQGKVNTPANLTDIAPTTAKLLHFDGFHAPDGHALTDAIDPAAASKPPPKLIVTLVWDAGGRDVLDFWKHNHPYLDSLIPKGTWYDRAEVGASPSATAPAHATIGTGAFPARHGIAGNDMLIDGHVIQPWAQGPKLMMEPTLADVYDLAEGNKPVVGVVGTTPWYLGMIGHGSEFGHGADRDIAVLRPEVGDEGAEGNYWAVLGADTPYYRFPGYVNSLPPLKDYFHVADASDGNVDGLWEGRDITHLLGGFDTPARLPYQTKVIETVLQREHFGQDSTPDLFYTNYKLIDEIGHLWYFNSPEEGDAVRVQDHELKVLVDFLNRDVGRGNYVLIMTADHGHTPDPKYSHGFRISGQLLKNAIRDAFGRKTLLSGKPTYLFINPELYVNPDQMATENRLKNGYTLTQIAQVLLKLTKGETAFRFPDAFGPADVPPPAQANDKIIQAAFPSWMITHMPCLPEAHGGPITGPPGNSFGSP